MLSKGARDGPLSPTMGITVQAPLLFSIPTRACSSFYRSGLSVTSSKPIYRLARLFPPSFSPIHASLSLPWSDRTPASIHDRVPPPPTSSSSPCYPTPHRSGRRPDPLPPSSSPPPTRSSLQTLTTSSSTAASTSPSATSMPLTTFSHSHRLIPRPSATGSVPSMNHSPRELSSPPTHSRRFRSVWP